MVENAHFYCNKDIDRLISETEATVTQGLEGGDRQRAMKRLRVPPLGEQQSPWITFKVGLFSGAFVVMLLAVVITGKNILSCNKVSTLQYGSRCCRLLFIELISKI